MTGDPRSIEEWAVECLQSHDPAGAADELCERHPELAPRIRQALARLESEQCVDQWAPTAWPRSVDGASSEAGPVDADAVLPRRLGHYRIRSRLGAGGMGIVCLAKDEKLGRDVAIKIVRPEHLFFFPEARLRFRREIEAIARLHHPGIVTVHTVGEQDGVPYFVMDYVRGVSLAELIADLAGTEPAQLHEQDLRDVLTRSIPGTSVQHQSSWNRIVIDIVRGVAAALNHAHERGVVHRDVKPSNILVDEDLRPHLLDFGLARAEDAQQLTKSASHLGSLPYMTPEQITGSADVTPALDVYSLGVTMYELLTLRSPFLGETADETRANIVRAAPVSLRALNPSVSRDLETVCLTAMDPNPARRYASMAAFADDLDRLVARRPIEARPAGLPLRIRRWSQRHPAATVGIAMVFALVVVLALFVVQQVRVTRETEATNYLLGILAASSQLDQFQAREARESLALCPPRLRGFEWHYLDLVANAHDAVYEGHTDRVLSVAAHPDGEVFASASRDGTVRIWRDDTTQELATLAAPGARAYECVWSRDGRFLFASFSDGRVLRWLRDGSGQTELRPAFDNGPSVPALAASPSGDRMAWGLSKGGLLLASGASEGPLETVEVALTAPARKSRFPVPVEELAFSRDGRLLFAAHQHNLIVIDVAAAREVTRLAHGPTEYVTAVVAPPELDEVITVTVGGRIRRWSLASGTVQADGQTTQNLGVNAGVIDSKRNLLWLASGRGVVAIHDTRSFDMLDHRVGHEGPVKDIALRHDGEWAITCSYDSTLRRWNRTTRGAVVPLGKHKGIVRCLALTGDGRCAITGGQDGRVLQWSLDGSGSCELLATGGRKGIYALDVTDRGRLLAVADERVYVLDLESGNVLVEISPDEPTRAGAWLADGSGFVVLESSGRMALFDVDGTEIASVPPRDDGARPIKLVVCPWNGEIVTTSKNGELATFSPRNLELRKRVAQELQWPRALTADANARVVLVSSGDGTIRFWDPSTGRVPRPDLRWPSQVISGLDVTADGQRLITSTLGREIQVWDRPSGQKLLLLRGIHHGGITAARFTPEGDRIVSTSMDGVVRLIRSQGE